MTRLIAWFHRLQASRQCARTARGVERVRDRIHAKPLDELARERLFRQVIASQAEE